jgi:D-hexose-6-phosphate mutarotase
MDLIELASASGHARISRRGAQVLDASFLPDQRLVWLSPQAPSQAATPGVAVRGGVPVCFPWFGKHPQGLPSHGFARNRDWRVLEHATDRAVFALDDDAETLLLWPHRFHAEMTISLHDGLDFAFIVTNTDVAPFRFSYALHTYVAVDSSRECYVDGLDGRLRQEAGQVTAPQRGAVAVDNGIDAVFERAADHLVLRDGERSIAVDADGMTSAVIWNPGASDIPDIGDQWRDFVCVERGRIGSAAVTVDPGQSHTGSMRLRLI